jgi:hypothetical protein
MMKKSISSMGSPANMTEEWYLGLKPQTPFSVNQISTVTKYRAEIKIDGNSNFQCL